MAIQLEQDRLERLAMRKPSDEWVQERDTYLGGTDVAAILGLHKYKTPRMVWMDKKGLLPPVTFNQAMLHGQNLELYVMQLYRLDTGRKLHKSHLYRDKDVEFFAVNPDYEIRGESGLLECKTANFFTGQNDFGEESDAIPNQYLVQCLWQLGITKRDWVDLAILIGGQDYRVYHVDRDDTLIDTIRQKAYDWWETYMLSNCPPPLTGDEGDCRLVKEQFPESNTNILQAGEDLDILCDQLRDARNTVKELDREVSRLENVIKSEMEDAGELRCTCGKITWRANKNGTRVFKPSFKEEELCRKVG